MERRIRHPAVVQIVAGARATLDALRKGLPEATEAGAASERLRVVLMLPDPRVFRAVVGRRTDPRP